MSPAIFGGIAAGVVVCVIVIAVLVRRKRQRRKACAGILEVLTTQPQPTDSSSSTRQDYGHFVNHAFYVPKVCQLGQLLSDLYRFLYRMTVLTRVLTSTGFVITLRKPLQLHDRRRIL